MTPGPGVKQTEIRSPNVKFPLSQLAGLLWTDSVSLTAHLQRAGVKLDSSHVWFGAKTVEGEWSTLIGPDPSRYCALIG